MRDFPVRDKIGKISRLRSIRGTLGAFGVIVLHSVVSGRVAQKHEIVGRAIVLSMF